MLILLICFVKTIMLYQAKLLIDQPNSEDPQNYLVKLDALLSGDLDFHGSNTGYASHDFHSFPAKFPPQLPRKFILGLTQPGEVVLDPMMGSGTTIVEAFLTRRRAIGFDIDPLAHLIAQVKITPLDVDIVMGMGRRIIAEATRLVQHERKKLGDALEEKWDNQTRKFVNYWFAPETQYELMALLQQIDKIQEQPYKTFFELIFSACIITKSGGVSLAFDLAHTRPHRAKIAYSSRGQLIFGEEIDQQVLRRKKFVTKRLRSALTEFERRFYQNARSLAEIDPSLPSPYLDCGDARNLLLDEASVDLIITSPPYASNAIDYMRAHKFSLVWLNHKIDELNLTRSNCIGGDGTSTVEFVSLPDFTANVVSRLAALDRQKGKVLHRYYSEMTQVLVEMFRVLKPGKAAILVVGSSVMRGMDIEIQNCLADIGREIGFVVPKTGIRYLDRNRRMMPAGTKVDRTSQIQQRMHEEYVSAFVKPEP